MIENNINYIFYWDNFFQTSFINLNYRWDILYIFFFSMNDGELWEKVLSSKQLKLHKWFIKLVSLAMK